MRDDAARLRGDLLERPARGPDDGGPQQEVLRRVAGDRELREEDEVRPRGLRLGEPGDDAVSVPVEVADDGVDLGERESQRFTSGAEFYPLGLKL